MKFYRNCPKCEKPISYNTKGDRQQGEKKNTQCKQCVADGRVYNKKPKQHKRNCPGCNKDIWYTELKSLRRAEREKRCCKLCCSPFKDGKNEKLSLSLNKRYESIRKEKECKTCKNIFIITNCDKDRIYCNFECYINDSDILKGKFLPSYNKEACSWFDDFNSKYGFEGIHALNNGEKKVLKYWVDYYEPNHNIVIEYDEYFHKDQKEKDIERQNKIINHLNCEFYRVNDKTKIITKIDKNGKEKIIKENHWNRYR